MNWKKFFTGEPMGDPHDPHYADFHETGTRAGNRFGRFLRLDKLSGFIYRHSIDHRKAFLIIVFGLVGGMFVFNTVRLLVAMSAQRNKPRRPVTEYVDSLMEQKKQQHDANIIELESLK